MSYDATTLTVVLDLLAQLETTRQAMHDAIAHGHMALVESRLSLQRNYGDLSEHQIPQELSAKLVTTVHESESDNEGLEIRVKSLIHVAPAAGARGIDSAEFEKHAARSDPVYWFSVIPPASLLRAQKFFVEASRQACVAASLQVALDRALL